MYRFGAILWDPSNGSVDIMASALRERCREKLVDLEPVLDVPGMVVVQTRRISGACRAYRIESGGVVLGQLFRRNPNVSRTVVEARLGGHESNLIEKTAGRHLVSHYWGRYVALLRSADGKSCWALRDPGGGLRCFYLKTKGILALFSDVEICAALGLTRLSVNWNHILNFLVDDHLITEDTGLEQISQLRPGEFAKFLPQGTRTEFYWQPASICEAARFDDLTQARNVLRRTVIASTQAWGTSYGTIVHETSGGLDSAIVASCLKGIRDQTRVLCLNYFTDTVEGDERGYAKAAAEAAAFEFVEARWDGPEMPLREQLDSSLLATPSQLRFSSGADRFRDALVADCKAGAIFSGRGGDQLFIQGRTDLGPAELLRNRGSRRGLGRLISEASSLSGRSFWQVLFTTVQYGVLSQRYDPYSVYEIPRILSEDARARVSCAPYQHPWVEGSRTLPAAKIRHAFMVADCLSFYMAPCPAAELVHPLLSQPVVECCLQIPSYLLTVGGRDRGLVRQAFFDDLPECIRKRHSKGGTTSYFTSILINNQEYLRAFLLDGLLVRQRIVDRRELENALTEAELVRGRSLLPLLSVLRAETWLDNWASVL